MDEKTNSIKFLSFQTNKLFLRSRIAQLRFKGLSTAVLDGVEQLIFRMDVPGGIDSVDLYAQRGFATQLYGIKKGSNIVVYGKTMVITYKSRVDSGNLGAHLAVQLDKIEVK